MFFSINEVHSVFKKKKKKKCLRLGVIIASESSDGHTVFHHSREKKNKNEKDTNLIVYTFSFKARLRM